MKKYTLFLLAFAFIFSLFSFNVNSASAANCAPGDLFSSTTGFPCGTTSTVPGCLPGYLFSPITGQSCRGTTPVYPPGCTSFSGFSITTGQPCRGGSDVQDLVVLSPNGGETWKKGTTQSIKWKDIEVADCPVGAYCAPPAPKFYDISLQPIWSCPPGPVACPTVMPAPYTIAKNVSGSSHSWLVGKNLDHRIVPDASYTIEVCQTGTSTCDSSDSYFKIVSSTTTPSITVIFPNGGETWKKGTTQTIKWKDTAGSLCPAGANCFWAGIPYDIKLDSYYPPCSGTICPMYYPVPVSRTIATSVYSYSYDWKIPSCTTNNPCSSNFEVPEGSYTIQVCQTDTSTCDSSDSYFKITSSLTQSSVTVLSPNGGESYKFGDKLNIKWNIVNPNQYPLGVYLQAFDEFGGKYILHTIATNVSWNTNEYSWTIPPNLPNPITPNKYLIRIVANPEDKFNSFEDSSNSYFKITSTQTNQPLSCSTLKETQQNYYDLCRDNGFDNVCFNKYGVYQGCTRNSSNDCTVNNVNASSNILCSVSTTQPSITFLSPSGGDIIIGDTYIIAWESANMVFGDSVAIQLYRNGVYQDQIAFNQPVTGTYSWTPSTKILPGSGYKIRVVKAYNNSNSIYDESNPSFNIINPATSNNPSFSVATPTTPWAAGSTQKIRWSSSNYPSFATVLIQLYQESSSGGPPTLTPYLSTTANNSGYLTWNIPTNTPQAPNYYILVTCDEVGLQKYGSCSGGISQAFAIVN